MAMTTYPLKATLVDDIDAPDAPAGAIKFTPEDDPSYLQFRCPCGCGLPGGLTLKGEQPWSWNGSRERATCTPSVGFYGRNRRGDGFHWHGFLTDGEWRLA
jgi:hypothetical protein